MYLNNQFDESTFNQMGLKYPDECPICNKKIQPAIQHAIQVSATDKNIISAVFLCPNDECMELFLGRYEDEGDWGEPDYMLSNTSPNTVAPRIFDDQITIISKSFVNIYNQARIADLNGLDQICGMGYRKALEFLIKDYSISKNPEKAEEIKNNHKLANVIKTYLDDQRLIDIAERAAWLGNDHSHYISRWESKDIEDLKTLIDMTLYMIQQELLYDHYIREMPKK